MHAVSTPPRIKYALNAQEERWVAYAWPIKFGVTGFRVMAIDINQQVYFTKNKNGFYSGKQKPKFNAAFVKGHTIIGGGAEFTYMDGNKWYPSP